MDKDFKKGRFKASFSHSRQMGLLHLGKLGDMESNQATIMNTPQENEVSPLFRSSRYWATDFSEQFGTLVLLTYAWDNFPQSTSEETEEKLHPVTEIWEHFPHEKNAQFKCTLCLSQKRFSCQLYRQKKGTDGHPVTFVVLSQIEKDLSENPGKTKRAADINRLGKLHCTKDNASNILVSDELHFGLLNKDIADFIRANFDMDSGKKKVDMMFRGGKFLQQEKPCIKNTGEVQFTSGKLRKLLSLRTNHMKSRMILAGREQDKSQSEREAMAPKSSSHNKSSGTDILTADVFKAVCIDTMSSQAGTSWYLIKLSVRNLKVVNRVMGFEAGDQLLLNVASAIKSVDPGVIAGSTHGSYFMILGKGRIPNDLMHIKQRIKEIEVEMELSFGGVFASIHAGISGNHSDYHTLYHQASEALQHSIDEGCNLMMYNACVREKAQMTRNVLSFTPMLLKAGLFRALYQPLCRVDTGDVVGYEMLMRWPEGALYYTPDQFIPKLEMTSLIVDFTIYTFEIAFEKVRQMGFQKTDTYISVNLSAAVVASDSGYGMLLSVLKRNLELLSSIRIEITERVAFRHDQVESRIRQMHRSLGIYFVIDDFGKGYADMDSINALPAEEVKIDKAFIEHCASESRHLIVLESIKNIIRCNNKTIVAEGVETEQQLQVIKDMGIDKVQGYLFGRPQPLGEEDLAEASH